MGFFKPKTPAQPTPAPAGPSAEEIRTQEEAKIREEQKQTLVSAESRRAKLRKQLVSRDEDEEEIQRKRLFGE